MEIKQFGKCEFDGEDMYVNSESAYFLVAQKMRLIIRLEEMRFN